jgi:hypothetical protein
MTDNIKNAIFNMAYSDKKYKKLGDVLKAYKIRYQILDNFEKIYPFEPSQHLTEAIQFTLKHIAYRISEEIICESILYPVLVEVWKPYVQYFSFWSHTSLNYDEELKGIPDYLITRLSPLGHIVLEQPYIAVVEAKLDDFVGGWAQCALEMIAMQKMNGTPEMPIYGIVSNGDIWQFAKLQQGEFVQYEQEGSIKNLPILMSLVFSLFAECKRIYIDEK